MKGDKGVGEFLREWREQKEMARKNREIKL